MLTDYLLPGLVIACCASGTRSAVARLRLRGLGFRHVVNAGPRTTVR